VLKRHFISEQLNRIFSRCALKLVIFFIEYKKCCNKPLTSSYKTNPLSLRYGSNIRLAKDFRSNHAAIWRSSNTIDANTLLRRVTTICSGRRTNLRPTLRTLAITEWRRAKPLLGDSLPLSAAIAHNPIRCLRIVIPSLRANSWEYTNIICGVGLSPHVTVDTCLWAVSTVDPAAWGDGVICCCLRSSSWENADYIAYVSFPPNVALKGHRVSMYDSAKEGERNLPLIQVSGP
jgi:hypothetical protein